MSGTQQFMLALLALLMPVITILLTFLLAKVSKVEAKVSLVAKGVDGLQDKLVADTRVIARMEGAQMEADKPDSHLTIHEAKT